MKKYLLTVCFSLFLGLAVFAQSITIKGSVNSEEDGSPIVGASVKVKGNTKVGTSTNNQGAFSFQAPSNSKTLLISAVGYVTREVTTTTDQISVKLKADDNSLNEVVVMGYGTAKKLSSAVGSFTQINAKDIEKRPVANVLDALQGRVAGLSVYTSSGEPSTTPTISLHGIGSLGASSALYIVMDGTPIDQNTLLTMNPQDIESVTVLKDASATSIYGSKAANGVMYVTTKKGVKGKPNISFQTQYGVSDIANKRFYEQFMNAKQFTGFLVDGGFQTQASVDALVEKYPSDTQWYKTYLRSNVPTYQVSGSASGGSDNMDYYISGGYFNQEGLSYRSGFERFTLRSNLNANITKWLKTGLLLGMEYDVRQSNPNFGTNNTNGGLAFLAAPYYSPIDPATGKEYPNLIPGWNRYNPKYLAENIKSPNNNAQFTPTVYLELTPIKGLTVRSQGGMDANDYRTTITRLPSYLGSPNNGSLSEVFARGVQRTLTNTAEYKFDLQQKHNFTVLVGQEYRDLTASTFTGSSVGQTDDRLDLLQNGPNTITVNSGKNEYAFKSLFSRLEYSFNDKYSASASVRQDISSLFGENNKKAVFWSAGLKWNAKEEDFLKSVKWIDKLNVSLNTGTSGNSDIGNYQSLALTGTNQYNSQTGWNISAPGNSNLTWEKQSMTNLGIEFAVLDRANLKLDFYNRVTSSMLIDVPYSYTSGFSSVTSNVGSLTNKGVDVTLSFDVFDRKQKDFFLTPYVNFNYNSQKVTALFQGKDYWIIPNTGVSWAIGQPVSFFYPIYAGINTETGAPRWYLPNEDPNKIVDVRKDPNAVTEDFTTASLQQSTGIKRYPPMIGGFGLAAGYKGFTFNADFTFALGKYLINNDRYFFENPNVFIGFNQSVKVLDYWKKPGDITTFPSLDYQFTQFDSRLIENASFMRLKNLTIGYNVPQNLIKKARVFKTLKVYVTGRNLLTVTKYTGPDPEIDSNLTLGAYPNTKQYVVGLDFSF